MKKLGVTCLGLIMLVSAQAAEFISVPGEAPKPQGRDLAGEGTSWFFKEFEIASQVESAHLSVTGLGVFEAYVNGQVVGDDVLKPGFYNVHVTRPFFTYDVTPLLKVGRNTLVGEVSSGWWRDKIVHYRGKKSAFYAILEIELKTGERMVIESDESWQGAIAGAVKRAGIFDGEIYDAREVQPVNGNKAWGKVEKNEEFKGKVVPKVGAEVVLRRDLAFERGAYSLKSGEKLTIDFGQNCAAVPEFVFKAKRGVKLIFLPGEMLNDMDRGKHGCDGPKGTVYRRNLRIPNAGMRMEYIFGSDEEETYRPRFTFFGYRYAEISADGEVEIKSVKSIPVTSVTKAMETGFIETGDKDVNRLIANIYWGQLSNYLSVPTDCPQRNERLGWTADTQIFAEAGAFNADTRCFFHKWMGDLRDSQDLRGGYPSVAPWAQYGNETMRFGWADAGIIVPYVIWRHFGDVQLVEECWESMGKYMRRVDGNNYEFGGYQYADWVSYEALETCSGRNRGKPETGEYWRFLGACYWLEDARMMAEMGAAIGKEVADYQEMTVRARDYLRTTFMTNNCTRFKTELFNTMQTPVLFALKLGLANDNSTLIEQLKANFARNQNRLQTGFLGTSILMDTLSQIGMTDMAYTLLLQHENPSWLYSVDQGATTIWERWNSYTIDGGFGPVGMNSFNHYAYGSVLSWMYKTMAGIASSANDPGFKTIIMRPIPDRRIGCVKAEYKSANGLIKSAWRYEGEKWIWDFTVPTGAKALVSVPGETKTTEYRPGTYRIELPL